MVLILALPDRMFAGLMVLSLWPRDVRSLSFHQQQPRLIDPPAVPNMSSNSYSSSFFVDMDMKHNIMQQQQQQDLDNQPPPFYWAVDLITASSTSSLPLPLPLHGPTESIPPQPQPLSPAPPTHHYHPQNAVAPHDHTHSLDLFLRL